MWRFVSLKVHHGMGVQLIKLKPNFFREFRGEGQIRRKCKSLMLVSNITYLNLFTSIFYSKLSIKYGILKHVTTVQSYCYSTRRLFLTMRIQFNLRITPSVPVLKFVSWCFAIADDFSCRLTRLLGSLWIAIAFLPIFWAARTSSLPAQHKSIIQSPSSESEWTILFSKSSLDFVWKHVVALDRTICGIATEKIVSNVNKQCAWLGKNIH